jgi:hypothetical protein
MSKSRYSPELAAKHAQCHPRIHAGLPHHLRCDYVRGEMPDIERCCKSADHTDEHLFVDEPKVNGDK